MAVLPPQDVNITSVRFERYKAFRSFSVSLQRMNILVGPNNCGKSTIIRAFRVLDMALRQARAKRAERISHDGHLVWGHRLSEDRLPISLENVHTDYEETDARVTFRCSTGNSLVLVFPADGGCILIPDAQGRDCHTPGNFRNRFPIDIQVVPELGPLEDEESVLTEHTIRRGLSTHRASRHFRNYWYSRPQGFEEFAEMVSQTWPGMVIEPPEARLEEVGSPGQFSQRLRMFCREDRMTRELYWSGYGFQVWCQLLTHISRGRNSTMLVVDEPEIYLHPDVQHQLVGILRDAGPDIVAASHSTEIIGEADPTEILIIDKTRQSATRLKEIEQVQGALDTIGSIHNIALTHLARTGRMLYVEGPTDFRILRRFARRLGYRQLAAGNDITPIESGGFGSWKKIEASAWAFERALRGQFRIGVLFDRDYFPDEEIEEVRGKLAGHFRPVHVHGRKELENYMLSAEPLERAVRRALRERARRTGAEVPDGVDIEQLLEDITSEYRKDVTSQLISKRSSFLRATGVDMGTLAGDVMREVEARWEKLGSRLELVPGKGVLKDLREQLSARYSISLTDFRIIDEFREDEIPEDFARFLAELEEFRVS